MPFINSTITRLLKGFARPLLGVGLLTGAMASSASVFYRFSVVAETPAGGLTGVGGGPSINDKGKVAFVGTFTNGPSILVWDPTTGVTDLASNFRSPNRSFGAAVKINTNDEIVTWNRLLPARACMKCACSAPRRPTTPPSRCGESPVEDLTKSSTRIRR